MSGTLLLNLYSYSELLNTRSTCTLIYPQTDIDIDIECTTYIKNFIANPCLQSAKALYDFYKEKYESIYNWKGYTEDHKLFINNLFKKDLLELIKEYEKVSKGNFNYLNYKDWQKYFLRLNCKKFKILLNNSDYKANLIQFLCQIDNPIVGDGWCHGIATYCIGQALMHDNIEITDSSLSGEQAIKISNYQYSPVYFENRYCVIPDTKLSFKNPLTASKFITKQIETKLLQVPKNSSFGIILSLYGNSMYTLGHALGIAKTSQHYFFIDANYGVFKFPVNNTNIFCKFIGWFLYKTNYCHYFNKFNLTNIPKFEEGDISAALPIQLQTTKHPLIKKQETLPRKVVNYVRDSLNQAHTVSAVIFSSVFSLKHAQKRKREENIDSTHNQGDMPEQPDTKKQKTA